VSGIAVRVRDVSKRFRSRGETIDALKGVSLDVERGEIFALLGPNGAGKSTLLNILMGILVPDSGGVEVLGGDVLAGRTPFARIGYASGEARFHPVLTAADIVNLYATAFGVPRAERRRRVDALIAEFGLARCRDRQYMLLSSGEKMRTALAKAFVTDPELIVLDEPTIGLDPDGAISIRREIARINREKGVTILLTSHYMREVEQLARRIAFIAGGEIVDRGSAGEVIARALPGRSFVVVTRAGAAGAAEGLGGLGFEHRGERHVRTLRSDESMGDLMRALSDLGVRPHDIEVGQPSLEDYFVHMVESSRNEHG